MKLYEYKRKIYCEEDISIENDDYAGDLYDLYWELRKDGKWNESTIYYTSSDSSKTYSEAEEMVEEEFSDLVIREYERSDEEWVI